MGRHGRFENFRIGPSLSNRIGTADSNSNRISKLRRSLSEGVMDDDSGESMEPMEEVPFIGLRESELERSVCG